MITITGQPAAGRLMAAYRPIIISADVTDNPPVVYCDVYIEGQYYKTFSKTQAPFQFDIQDALQEYILKYVPANGGSSILQDLLHGVFVRIRSSTIDSNGFINPDVPVPIQGNPSTPGGGTESNSFFVVNATLQHEDNQDLETHLSYFKNGTWNNSAWPLTHRPSSYKICNNDSDYFPIILKTGTVGCLRLNYKLKGQTGFQTISTCGGGGLCETFAINTECLLIDSQLININ